MIGGPEGLHRFMVTTGQSIRYGNRITGRSVHAGFAKWAAASRAESAFGAADFVEILAVLSRFVIRGQRAARQ